MSKRSRIIFSAHLLAFYLLVPSLSCAATIEKIRVPYVAGSFYPADKNELSGLIDRFLVQTPLPQNDFGDIKALILPHAGYIYSGPTAAYGYKLIASRHYDTVVLVGPSHSVGFSGASIWKSGAWRTPLGDVPVDETLAEAIAKESALFDVPAGAHGAEHSLEVQIPFLQKVQKDFKIVPILVSDPSPENTRRLAQAIFKNTQGRNVLVIASSDMSHYYEDSVARTMDTLTLDLLSRQEPAALLQKAQVQESELCGLAAVLTVLELSRLWQDTDLKVIHYGNSGDSTRDKSRVVGYGAAVIYKPMGTQTVSANQKKEINLSGSADLKGALTLKEGKELLKIARQTMEAYVASGKTPEITVNDPALNKDGAVFVTLMEKEDLRGCIGSLVAHEALYRSVQNMTIEAASSDPRFSPVKPEELNGIRMELSVLSAPIKVPSAAAIILGKHGVIVKQGLKSGVFLPKVANETHWTKEEFLNDLCTEKAGLPFDCWRHPSTELYVFTSQDFSE